MAVCIYFHTADRSDTNRNLFSKLSDVNYLPWLIMFHGSDNIAVNVKLHEDGHKQLKVLLTIHSHVCLCFNWQNPEGLYTNVGGVDHFRKHDIELKCLPSLDLKVHREDTHNCLGVPFPICTVLLKHC